LRTTPACFAASKTSVGAAGCDYGLPAGCYLHVADATLKLGL
jgi:hypothetical protein